MVMEGVIEGVESKVVGPGTELEEKVGGPSQKVRFIGNKQTVPGNTITTNQNRTNAANTTAKHVYHRHLAAPPQY